MEVTRQLRKEKLNKKGTDPIQLIFCWDNRRLRFGSGEACRPADWNAKREEVRDKAPYAAVINKIFDR